MSEEKDNTLAQENPEFNQIDKYLQEHAGSEKTCKSFMEIILGFITDYPNRAAIFSNDRSSRAALELLKEAAVLLEHNFQDLEFEKYLSLCINREHSLEKICALSQWYKLLLTYGDEKNDTKSIHFIYIKHSKNPIIQFCLWQPVNKFWFKKNVSLREFSKSEQKKLRGTQNIKQKQLVEKVILKCGVYLFYVNRPHRQEIFELLTHVIYFALAVYDADITAETRTDSLIKAVKYLEKVCLVNLTQSENAKNSRPDALQELILQIARVNMKITWQQLLDKLRDHSVSDREVIEDIVDEDDDNEKGTIYFIQDGVGGHTALISGLNPRLNRAIKQIKLENNSP